MLFASSLRAKLHLASDDDRRTVVDVVIRFYETHHDGDHNVLILLSCSSTPRRTFQLLEEFLQIYPTLQQNSKLKTARSNFKRYKSILFTEIRKLKITDSLKRIGAIGIRLWSYKRLVGVPQCTDDMDWIL